MMRNMWVLAVLAMAACASKAAPSAPDFGLEDGKDDSAKYPGTSMRIDYGSTVDVNMANGVNWRAFVFHGNAGQYIDAYAQGMDGTDTVLYIYKVSRISGRPYGSPLAVNDDSASGGWALQKAPWNEYSSSIIGLKLPEARDYAMVLTTYEQQGGRALVRVNSAGAVYGSPPAFRGTASGTQMHFVEGTTAVLDVVRYAPSQTIQTSLSDSAGLVARAAIYVANPTALDHALADPNLSGDLVYGFLLDDPNTNHYDATMTPTTRANAAAELVQAASPDDGGVTALTNYVLGSIFRDSAFRASDVDVYRLHWDNSDDTNAEGIAAIKASTGEVRVFSLQNPP